MSQHNNFAQTLSLSSSTVPTAASRDVKDHVKKKKILRPTSTSTSPTIFSLVSLGGKNHHVTIGSHSMPTSNITSVDRTRMTATSSNKHLYSWDPRPEDNGKWGPLCVVMSLIHESLL